MGGFIGVRCLCVLLGREFVSKDVERRLNKFLVGFRGSDFSVGRGVGNIFLKVL